MSVPALRFPKFVDSFAASTLAEFCDIDSGFPVSSDEISEIPCNPALLRGANITEGRVHHGIKIDRYFTGYNGRLERYLVKENDVVIGMDGSKVGKNIAVISSEDAGSFLIQRVARLRENAENHLAFSYHILTSMRFRRYVDIVNTSSGIPHISLKQIRDFPIGKPSPAEQKKIADFLGAVDEKIRLLRARHDQLETYKKGVMQKIFAQDTRFKADDGSDFPDWGTNEFEKLLYSIPTRNHQVNRSDYVEEGQFPVIDQGQQFIVGYSDDESKVLQNTNCIVFGDHTTELKYVDFDFIVGADGTKILRSRSDNLKYLFYFLVFNNVEQEGYKRHYSILRRLVIDRPALQEQQKIADFLSVIDDKINAVSAQIDQMQDFKKGLLQQMFV